MNEGIKERLSFYIKKCKPIHVRSKNGRFYNGYVLEEHGAFFLLNDFKVGEIPIFFDEIDVIEGFVK